MPGIFPVGQPAITGWPFLRLALARPQNRQQRLTLDELEREQLKVITVGLFAGAPLREQAARREVVECFN